MKVNWISFCVPHYLLMIHLDIYPETARRSNQSILKEISPGISDAGRDWEQEEKGTTEDEKAGWRHWLDGHESQWTPGVGDGLHGVAESRTRLSGWSDLIVKVKKNKKNKLFKYYVKMDYKIFQAGKWEVTEITSKKIRWWKGEGAGKEETWEG